MYKKGRNYPAFFCLQGVQIVVYRSVLVTHLATNNPCHCEPVRRLAWQSPPNFRNVDGDSHVGPLGLLGMTCVF